MLKMNNIKRFAAMMICLILSIGTNTLAIDNQSSSDLMLLLNKSHNVSADYIPENITNIAQFSPSYKGTLYLRDEAAKAYLNMYDQIVADGIYNMKALSGLRDFNYQTGLFNRQISRYKGRGEIYASAYEKASWSVAIPGTSEHQTGLAIDVSTDGTTSMSFRNTKAGIWMRDNSWKYGFVLRYPDDKTQITKIQYEPWHFRYVGKPHAQFMYENNMCYEEYIEHLQSAKHITQQVEGSMQYDVYYTTDPEQNYANITDFSSDNCGGYIITTYTASQQNVKQKGVIKK